jgi:hypothetical protein
MTAAADRRVKDAATRSVTVILHHKPRIGVRVLERLAKVDDDEVRERSLLSCYGAFITTRDLNAIRETAEALQRAYVREPAAFDNALIRDDLRCIFELAHELGVAVESELTMQPIKSDWPLEMPSDAEVESWEKVIFRPDEFASDFFKYSMECLRPWTHAVAKTQQGRWILQRVARDFQYIGSGSERYDRYMRGKYGAGRAKPVWAERIGKKYQWIALYQLGSRLHDHVERKRDSWEPEHLRTPLILLEERKIDPTLPRRRADGSVLDAWRITGEADLGTERFRSDTAWVKSRIATPALQDLLLASSRAGQNWRALMAHVSWDDRDDDADSDKPYRQLWVNVQSFLVLEEDVLKAFKSLERRNMFGNWLPDEANWAYGFAGEYPWATAFNTEAEQSNGRSTDPDRGLPVTISATWSRLNAEWSYDASQSQGAQLHVPSRDFFSAGDLWWNGTDGYRDPRGKTIFRDPSITEGGPTALLVDADELFPRLKKLGLRVLWTLLGERWILGSTDRRSEPRRTFSQVAYLDKAGDIKFGAMTFFTDRENPGARKKVKAKRRGR